MCAFVFACRASIFISFISFRSVQFQLKMIFSMLARCCTHIAHEKLNTRIVIWRTWTFVCLLAGTQAYTHIANSMFLARTAIAFRPDLMHVELEEKETAPSTQRRPISSNQHKHAHKHTKQRDAYSTHNRPHIRLCITRERREPQLNMRETQTTNTQTPKSIHSFALSRSCILLPLNIYYMPVHQIEFPDETDGVSASA